MSMKRFFRPSMLEPCGMDLEQFKTVMKVAMEEHEGGEETFLNLMRTLRNNNVWLLKEAGVWRRFQRAVLGKVREYSCHPIYPKMVDILAVRFCEHCLLSPEADQRVCKRHREHQMALYRKLPMDLVRLVMQFVGVVRSADIQHVHACTP